MLFYLIKLNSDFSNNNFKGSLPESLNKLYFLEKL